MTMSIHYDLSFKLYIDPPYNTLLYLFPLHSAGGRDIPSYSLTHVTLIESATTDISRPQLLVLTQNTTPSSFNLLSSLYEEWIESSWRQSSSNFSSSAWILSPQLMMVHDCQQYPRIWFQFPCFPSPC